MATVNFSVPDEVKDAFDQAFGDRNKSAIIADLLRQAVREEALNKRRERLLEQLNSGQSRRKLATASQVRKARSDGRP